MAFFKLSHLFAWSISLLFLHTISSIRVAAALSAPSGNGPVIDINFPDPTVISVDGTWYAFATNNQNHHINVQIASSTDFGNWTVHDADALPTLPDWALEEWESQVWAPDVNQTPDGSFVMYYAALTKLHPRKHCVGAATSSTVLGPYTPLNSTIACDLPAGGDIDPNLFQDPVNHAAYLVYKTDGNAIGSGGACGNSNPTPAPTPLRQQSMNVTDLTTPLGASSFVLDNVPADGPNIERPSMFYHAGTYYLLYNSGCYADESYEVRYLACVGAPDFSWCDWTAIEAEADAKATKQVLLKTGEVDGVMLYAPGSVDVSVDGTKMLFHADMNPGWLVNRTGERVRGMYAAKLVYSDGGAQLGVGGFY